MTKQLNIDIIAKDKTKQALRGVQGRLNQVKSSVFSLKGALVGIGAGAVIRSFVNVGKEVESLQVRFKFLFGSVEEGAVAFDNLTKFAGKVPFSLEEISRASGNLAVVADDANDLNRILEITGNVAAVTGLDFETTSSQIQRAFSGGIGAADLFRERGVRALLGFQAGAKVTAEETIKRFEELFAGDGQFANATKDLATTLEGTISMIGDKYFNFQKDVAEGFFDEIKKEFGDLNVFLEKNEDQIKDIATAIGENFAGAISKTSELLKGIAPTVKNIGDAIGTTIDGFNSLPPFVKETGLIAALFLGKKGYAALAGVSFLIGEMKEVIKDSAGYTGIINVDEINNVDELSERLKVLKEQKDALVNMGAPLIGDPETMDEEARQLQTIITNIDNVTQRIAILNALNIEMGDAYSYASSKGEDLKNTNDEIFKGGIQDAKDYLARQKSINEAQEYMNKRTEQFIELRNRLTTGIEALKEAYDPYLALQREEEENLRMLEMAKVNGIYSDTEMERLKTEVLKKGIEDRKALREREVNEQLRIFKSGKFQELEFNELSEEAKKDFTIKAGKEVLGALAKNNKKAFELNKALATAEAIVNTAQGVTKALASANYVQAFLIGAMGAIQVATIQSQQYQGKALGGRVQAGSSYMVGEGGKPEMFVPDQSGTIIPNSQLGKATNVYVTINANDTEGFDDLLIKRRSTIVNVINDALNSQGKEALI
jgi:hypothetical protein